MFVKRFRKRVLITSECRLKKKKKGNALSFQAEYTKLFYALRNRNITYLGSTAEVSLFSPLRDLHSLMMKSFKESVYQQIDLTCLVQFLENSLYTIQQLYSYSVLKTCTGHIDFFPSRPGYWRLEFKLKTNVISVMVLLRHNRVEVL